MEFIDIVIFIVYAIIILSVGLYVSREKKGHVKNEEDYFLASRSLPWWAIGASLIASNISAEQFIGMSGSGYAIGLAIASYEWMAAITLLIVGKFLLPVFLKKGIYTMPQFLEMRFDGRIKSILAFFWLLTYIFVNLTSVMYLGALTLETFLDIPLINGMIGLAAFSALYSFYGGLKAVAWTDLIQVVFLAVGGLITALLAISAVADTYGGTGIIDGLAIMIDKAPMKFDMILSPDNPNYKDLPGLGVLLGGMWVANLFYWGFNQYIIQRGLAAKSIEEAQKGIIFAAVLKLIMPLIVVVPGIAAFVINMDDPSVIDPADQAFPWVLKNLVPVGIKGLTFAALVAAIVSSLASMLNSTSTIFTFDIYKTFIDKDLKGAKAVTVGRISASVALIIALFAAKPLLGGLDQAFQYIQNYTGMISPGILAVFLTGMFWKKATANAAVWAAILTIPLGIGFQTIFPDMPFLDRMGYVFLVELGVIGAISMIELKGKDAFPKAFDVTADYFHTSTSFNIGAMMVLAVTAFLYLMFW